MVHFYLGAHEASWLEELDVPMFLSRRRFGRNTDRNKTLFTPGRPRGRPPRWPKPKQGWALDSGGFTELILNGGWPIGADQYADEVEQLQLEVGKMAWAAPQDWMCEPGMLRKTGLTVREHQDRTVENFLQLRQRLGELVIPVVQGWTIDQYLECVELYQAQGVELEQEPLVGIGSICRRGQDHVIFQIVATLRQRYQLKMHGFGVRGSALQLMSHMLISADSMAWAYHASRRPPLPGCTHVTCASCKRYALQWREHLLDQIGAVA